MRGTKKSRATVKVHNIDNGSYEREITSYQDLVWAVAGLASLYSDSPWHDKVLIRREIKRLLFSSGNAPDYAFIARERSWQISEFIYVTNYLLDHR